MQQETIVLSAAETAVISELGLDAANVVVISYSPANIEGCESVNTTTTQEQVDVLQLVFEEEDEVMTSTSVLFQMQTVCLCQPALWLTTEFLRLFLT